VSRLDREPALLTTTPPLAPRNARDARENRSTERNDGHTRLRCMDTVVERAREELQAAEAELAVLKQEQVIRDLLRRRKPTVEATARLRQLREAAESLPSRNREERSAQSHSRERRHNAA
jgi:hypothetical protein